jgi:hypothetical protein
MIRNADINDPHNTEMHRDVRIIVVILYQFEFRIISGIEGFRVHENVPNGSSIEPQQRGDCLWSMGLCNAPGGADAHFAARAVPLTAVPRIVDLAAAQKSVP